MNRLRVAIAGIGVGIVATSATLGITAAVDHGHAGSKPVVAVHPAGVAQDTTTVPPVVAAPVATTVTPFVPSAANLPPTTSTATTVAPVATTVPVTSPPAQGTTATTATTTNQLCSEPLQSGPPTTDTHGYTGVSSTCRDVNGWHYYPPNR